MIDGIFIVGAALIGFIVSEFPAAINNRPVPILFNLISMVGFGMVAAWVALK